MASAAQRTDQARRYPAASAPSRHCGVGVGTVVRQLPRQPSVCAARASSAISHAMASAPGPVRSKSSASTRAVWRRRSRVVPSSSGSSWISSGSSAPPCAQDSDMRWGSSISRMLPLAPSGASKRPPSWSSPVTGPNHRASSSGRVSRAHSWAGARSTFVVRVSAARTWRCPSELVCSWISSPRRTASTTDGDSVTVIFSSEVSQPLRTGARARVRTLVRVAHGPVLVPCGRRSQPQENLVRRLSDDCTRRESTHAPALAVAWPT